VSQATNFKCVARRGTLLVLAMFAMQSVALARCPIPAGGLLFLRAPLGNLLVDTSVTGFIEVEVSDSAIEVEEQCFDDHVEISGTAPARRFGPVDWRIRVPASVDLDLITFAGGVRVATTEGSVILRTTGGNVVMGDIGGTAAVITQGGSILVGNIGGDAELRSLGGQIEIGDVLGNAELETLGGPIRTGTISGQVQAETAGGSINIQESQGDLNAITLAGDIVIGTAGKATVQTAGGNIIGLLIRGAFQGFTELGDIRIERAESSIEATSGFGDIEVRLAPPSLDGDLHVELRTTVGNIRLAIPANLPANLETVIERTLMQAPRVRSDFPLRAVGSGNNSRPSLAQGYTIAQSDRSVTELNGGGNVIRLQTSRGTIEIRRIRQ
jgi:hypothetical protein